MRDDGARELPIFMNLGTAKLQEHSRARENQIPDPVIAQQRQTVLNNSDNFICSLDSSACSCIDQFNLF